MTINAEDARGVSRAGSRGPASPPTIEPLDAGGQRDAGLLTRLRIAWSLAFKAGPLILVLYVTFAVVGSALPIAAAWLTKRVLDKLAVSSSITELLALATALAAAGITASAVPHLTRLFQYELQRSAGVLAQERLFAAVDRIVGLSYFENPRFLDRLRLAQQAGGPASTQVPDGVIGIGSAATTILGFLGTLYILSPAMAGLVILAGVPTVFAQIALSRKHVGMLWTIGPNERREHFYNQLLTSVAAAKEIRLFGIGRYLRGRMLDERRSADSERRTLDRHNVKIQLGLSFVAATASGGGLLWAVLEAKQGRLTLGDIAIFIAAVAGVQSSLTALAVELGQIAHSLSMFGHYVAITSTRPDLVVVAGSPSAPLTTAIEFRDVWFRYTDDGPWILSGVSFRINAGESLAIVGLNGAGKSTVVKLLCRMYDPCDGQITWDDVDLRDIDPAELRKRISALFQDFMHYDLTARENIGLGDVDSRHDGPRLEDAAHRAGLHKKIAALPFGYDTLLSRTFLMPAAGKDNEDGRAGVTISDGQWQRLSLARAFFRRRRDLLILDEPSAWLDPDAEQRLLDSLSSTAGTATTLLISHRLSAMQSVDRILTLSDGRIAEEGTHAELLKRGGQYAQLYSLQAARYQT